MFNQFYIQNGDGHIADIIFRIEGYCKILCHPQLESTCGAVVAFGTGLGVQGSILGLYRQTIIPLRAKFTAGRSGLVGIVTIWTLLKQSIPCQL